jgi:hypothetical protein
MPRMTSISAGRGGALQFDSSRSASLDGEWDFFPGDHAVADLRRLTPVAIRVPGLWEAQGHLDLDGVAWYRRRFRLEETEGDWTLRFGAVMDAAEVYLNGAPVGGHDRGFTPFELDAGAALVAGDNELAVRVADPAVDDPDHLRTAHGKQGWANNLFPSRPSLYMTYGGIWQPVTLRRHGRVVVDDVFVNGDPDDLVVTVEVANRGPETVARVGMRTLGLVRELEVELPAAGRRLLEARLGRVSADHWRPERPVLHDAVVDVRADDALSDSRVVRFGLRVVSIDAGRIVIDGDPYRMKSVLVQGFRGDTLYAEGDRDRIREEVAAARAMGFNTLRLHIKAFDPTYLDVCDEMGMLLHCDIPVAEPIAYEDMGGETLLTRRCVAAARDQVRRDRNHPSIVLWSAMNEIGLADFSVRRLPGYEAFVRAVAGAVQEEDPTRPVIENDWVEPDPDEVMMSPILTAHWYGRLHRDYLDRLERDSARWAGTGKVLLVTEFGDWGLPEMPPEPDPPFWDTRAIYASALAQTLWPGTVGRFLVETQRYQGLSDRLQAEVFRRHDHIGGYCLTELTDVPHELNGVLDLARRPKPLAVAEVTRANQVVLPILRLESLVMPGGGLLHAPLQVANDGPALHDVTVEARFGDSPPAMGADQLLAIDATGLPAAQVEERFRETEWQVRLGDVDGYGVTEGPTVAVVAPDVPGSHDLVLRLRVGDRSVAENRYPIHVVAGDAAPYPVRLVGAGTTADALRSVGAVIGEEGPTVVAEGALDAASGADLAGRLERGEVVVVLAQSVDAAEHYPAPVELQALETVWGSTLFTFTTDHGAIPSLPRHNVLVAEDSTVQASSVVSSIAGRPFPDTPVVIAYKPVPGAMTGTVLGSHPVGRGRLAFCQYRLAAGAASGDAAACGILADLLRWAAVPRPVIERDVIEKDDGRQLHNFYWLEEVAR